MWVVLYKETARGSWRTYCAVYEQKERAEACVRDFKNRYYKAVMGWVEVD